MPSDFMSVLLDFIPGAISSRDERDSQYSVVGSDDGAFASKHVTHERAIKTACYVDCNKYTHF